jgi:hypothetical protein
MSKIPALFDASSVACNQQIPDFILVPSGIAIGEDR